MKKIEYEFELEGLDRFFDQPSDFEEDKHGNLTGVVLDRVKFQDLMYENINQFVNDNGYEGEGDYDYKIIDGIVIVTVEVEVTKEKTKDISR